MLKEVDELVGQVVKAIPDRKRHEVKFSHSEINGRPKMSLKMYSYYDVFIYECISHVTLMFKPVRFSLIPY